MKIHIIDGNTKIGKTPNVSLPPVHACGDNCRLCKFHCYAIKFYRMYPDVKKAWDENLYVLNNDRSFYFDSIRRYLLWKRPEYFRWHVAGDIIDQHYFYNMCTIADDYDFTNFLVFTKMYDLDFSGVPFNLSVVLSVWPGIEIKRTDLPLAFVNFANDQNLGDHVKCFESCEECRVCWHLKKKGLNVLLKYLNP